jgi:hypothetical protein
MRAKPASSRKTRRGCRRPWLKLAGTFLAQNGEPAGTSTLFFGYDGKHARWVVTGADTTGSYFTNYSNSANLNGSQWYDGYPNNHGSAIVHSTSTTYTVDSKGPGPKGKVITTHEVCTKQ